jgi:hypothetical protein
MSDTAASTPVRAAMWKRVIASILDFITIFVVGGYGIAVITGSTTSKGFQLTGLPAVAWFALLVAYFYLGRRHLGGTLWDRIFGIRRPQPS